MKLGLSLTGRKRSINKEHSLWVLFEVAKYVLKRLEMTKSWGDTTLSKGIDSIVNVKATKGEVIIQFALPSRER